MVVWMLIAIMAHACVHAHALIHHADHLKQERMGSCKKLMRKKFSSENNCHVRIKLPLM